MLATSLPETRRRFLAHFSGIGLGSTLVPAWQDLSRHHLAHPNLDA